MDYKKIRQLLPSSVEQVEQVMYENMDNAYVEFGSVDFDAMGLSRVANSFELWKRIKEMDAAPSEHTAMQVCQALQLPVIDAVYPNLCILPNFIDNDQLFSALAVVVTTHIATPQLHNNLPTQGDFANSDSQADLSDLPGPLTLMKQFKTVASIEMDLVQYLTSCVEAFTANKLFSLLDLFCSFGRVAELLHTNPAQAIADMFDLAHIVNNDQLNDELACIAFGPHLDVLLQLVDSPGVNLASNARDLLQHVMHTAMTCQYNVAPHNAILAQSFAIPCEIFSRQLQRLHFDVLFETLDNSSRCLTNGTFVRLLAISVTKLEQSMASFGPDGGVIEFNRMIDLLNPPLSSLAIQCHLIYQVSKALLGSKSTVCETMAELFTNELPPIPLRHFETFKSQKFQCATQGMDFDSIDRELLITALQSLLCGLSRNLPFFAASAGSQDLDMPKLVISALFCAFNVLEAIPLVEPVLAQLVQVYDSCGLVALCSTVLNLGKQSLMLTGQGIYLVSRVLEIGDKWEIQRQLETHRVLLQQLITQWHQTNTPAMSVLITQLQDEYGLADVLGTQPSFDSSTWYESVLLDLGKLRLSELMPPPRAPPINRRVLASSKSFPNLGGM